MPVSHSQSLNRTEFDWLGRQIEHFFVSQDPPSEFALIANLHVAMSAASLLYHLVILCVLVQAYLRPRSKSTLLIVKLMLAMVFFASWTFFTSIFQGLPTTGCQGRRPIVALCYGLTYFFYFLLLGERAATSILRSEGRMKMLARALQLCTFGMIPLAAICLFVMTDVRYFDTFCLLRTGHVLPTFFLVANSCMSIAFLGLFFYPLWRHVKRMKAASIVPEREGSLLADQFRNDPLEKRAKLNFRLSAIALSSSVLTMLLMAALEWDGRVRVERDFAFVAMIQYPCATCELNINTTTILIMFKAWRPVRSKLRTKSLSKKMRSSKRSTLQQKATEPPLQ